MIDYFASCVAGTKVCNDTGSVLEGPPSWVLFLILVAVVAVVIVIVRGAVGRRKG